MPNIHKLHKQYGGDGIPFSKMKGRTRDTTKKKKTTKKQKKYSKTKKQKKKGLCSCKKHPKHIKDPSPNGLGKCAECLPLHIIIKGKNKKLWENKMVRGKHMWVQVY